jgi:hypothetical protein
VVPSRIDRQGDCQCLSAEYPDDLGGQKAMED